MIIATTTSQKAPGRLVSDQLWELLEPLIPPPTPAKEGRTGQPRVDDRAALNGILFVAEHGIAWQKASIELGFSSEITSWRRPRAWQEAGLVTSVHHAVLKKLGQDGQRDLSGACP